MAAVGAGRKFRAGAMGRSYQAFMMDNNSRMIRVINHLSADIFARLSLMPYDLAGQVYGSPTIFDGALEVGRPVL